jgi:hypothetical protein
MNTATPLSNAAADEELGRHHAMSGTGPNHLGVHAGAVSWGAILAGAAAAAALYGGRQRDM